MTFILRHPTLASFIFISASITTMTAEDADSPARAAYPKPFSRPHSMGDDYDTWRDATGPDIGETSVDTNRLPSRVDNSTRPQFPPIYKQKGGACGQFTAVASIFTYEMNVLNGTEADTTATQFPADFSWNMCNAAKSEQGSEAHHGWETAKHIGIPTVKSYGRVEGDKDKIGSWATLHIDHAKGIITGHAPAGAGRHEVTFHAENDHGKDERKLTFVVGDKLALTPPMGWNHWYTHYLNITDTIIRNAADEMVKSGMADVGYQYISRTARLCSGPVFRQTRN